MDVGGAEFLCAGEDVVDEADDGCLSGEVTECLFGVAVDGVAVLVVGVVEGGDVAFDEGLSGDDEAWLGVAEGLPGVGDVTGVVGGGDGEGGGGGVPFERQAGLGVEEVAGDVGEGSDVAGLVFVEEREARGLGVDGEELFLGESLLLDEGLVGLWGAAGVGESGELRGGWR